MANTDSEYAHSIARFFDVFTSFRLFHIPTWQTKLRQIPTTSQRTALLAAMLAWAVKGLDNDGLNQLVEGLDLKSSPDEPSIHFRAISLKHMDEAITECWDEPLSLPLLQTMIMNTQCLLVQGVRGRAWRYLGVCVRSAYEMNLHLIDAEERRNCDGSHLFDAERWCREEEWRRAWWAMWEMDIYASVIRRCPAAIDWSQNETFLPAEDDNWYSAKPQQSCRLDINPTSRWKCLAATNNRSPKAWFIVINSLMKDAQKISSPVSIDQGASATLAQDSMRSSSPVADSACPKAKKQQHSINRLNIILNSLHCTLLALPKELKYTGQHLEFTPNYRLSPDAGGRNLRASSIYSIYVMAQLTKLMAIKYHIFRTGWEWTIPLLSTSSDNDFYGPSDPSQTTAEENERRSIASPEYRYLGQYFEAADNVIHIIRATSEDHHQCVNPFLASTIWLAGALQLVRSDMAASDSSEKDLYTSNFEMVSLIYQKFVDFWGMSKIPLKHWATLGSGLKEIRRSLGQGHNLRYETPCLFAGGISAHRPTLRPSSKEYILATTSTSPPSNIYPLEVTDHLGKSSTMPETLKTSLLTHLGSKDRPGQAPWGLSSASNTQAYSIENQTTSFEPDTTVSVDMTSNNTLAYQNPASETRLEYDFPSLWGQPNHHDRQPLCNEISSTGLPDPEQDSIPGGSAGQNLSLPDNLDSMPYGYDWAISTNFSTYLDEILSGSYLP